MTAIPNRCRVWALASLTLGCSSLGGAAGVPDGLPHGGTGQFRLLESTETGITSPLPGRVMVLRNRAIEAAMVLGETLFYAQATQLEEPPPEPEDHPAAEVFTDAFEPFAIHRGTAREEGTGAFDAGEAVLTATEAWEGESVRDPWAVAAEDGSIRLYYAAEGGIGIATAPSVDGPYTRAAQPALDASIGTAASPRHPTVIAGLDAPWTMYFDGGDGVWRASSDDGLSWRSDGPIVLEGDDEAESPESRVAHPSAVRVETSAGRILVRLYFESIREDGSHRAYVAGSDDGVFFERHPREVTDLADVRFPSPLIVDSRITLLYLNLPFSQSGYQNRALSAAVGPAGQRFDEADE